MSACLGGSLSRELPAREHQHGGMATQCAGQHFGTLNTQPNTIVLNGRKRRLGNAAPMRERVLTETLELTNDPDGFSDRDFSALLGGTELIHSRLPVIVRCEGSDLEQHVARNDPIDNAILQPEARRPVAFPLTR